MGKWDSRRRSDDPLPAPGPDRSPGAGADPQERTARQRRRGSDRGRGRTGSRPGPRDLRSDHLFVRLRARKETMMDDTVPFPAAEAAETDRKPSRRRRGGARRHKAFPASGRGNRAGPAPAPRPRPSPASVPARPMNVSSAPPDPHLGRAAALPLHRLREHRARRPRRAVQEVRHPPRAPAAASRRARSCSRRPTPTGRATREYKREFHEAAIELIDIPQRNYTAKNSADIRMVVDAMDLVASKEHITTFVILSGDSRLLAAGLEAQGERQVRDRRRGQELDLEPADRQLRRVHLLRGPRARDARPAVDRQPAEEEAGGVPALSSTRSRRSAARTTT